MSVRDSNVLHAHEILGEIPFRTLAQGLLDAVAEAEVEGIDDPSRDPAVMVFGAFIAFATHADTNTVGGYYQLIEQCRTRHESEQATQ